MNTKKKKKRAKTEIPKKNELIDKGMSAKKERKN